MGLGSQTYPKAEQGLVAIKLKRVAHVQNKCGHVFDARGGYAYPLSGPLDYMLGHLSATPYLGVADKCPNYKLCQMFCEAGHLSHFAIQLERSLVLNMSQEVFSSQ
jgi:hypothetical protein